jgi:hypothetical protein
MSNQNRSYQSETEQISVAIKSIYIYRNMIPSFYASKNTTVQRYVD